MDASEYQELAARTLNQKPGFRLTEQEMMVLWTAVGISGEAGEIMEAVKKGVFHRHALDGSEIGKELGDILWYIAGLCTVLGWDMSKIMEENIKKLRVRYPNGFSPADSIKRIDVDEKS